MSDPIRGPVPFEMGLEDAVSGACPDEEPCVVRAGVPSIGSDLVRRDRGSNAGISVGIRGPGVVLGAWRSQEGVSGFLDRI